MDAKEEVKARLPVEDVIGQYVELKRAGRNLKALSPWTGEKTASFMVSPEKGIWHDYSSGKGGDIFTFVMEMEGLTFVEALKLLAGRAGVDLKMYGSDGADTEKKRKRFREAHKLAAKYYQAAMMKNKHALDYIFYKRNLNRQTISDFLIGYAPNTGNALLTFLKSKGFQSSELAEAGLLNRFSTDMFRGRMMIPLMDTVGAVIGFTARALKSDEQPKYLNTTATLLYDKGRHVFGLSQAKESIRINGFAVIVEGNMDVISSHQAGVKNVVATAGTAMTEDHLKALSRLTSDIRLAYDADKAGVAAAERSIALASRLDIKLSVISDYGDAKDPDELIQKDPKLWQAAVAKKLPAVDWLLSQYEARLDLETGEGKREYSDVALKLVNQLGDEVEREHYLNLVHKRLDISEKTLRNKMRALAAKEGSRRLKRPKVEPQTSENTRMLEQNIIAIMLLNPGKHDTIKRGGVGDVKKVEREDEDLVAAILDKIKALDYTERESLILRGQTRYEGWSDEDLESEFQDLVQKMKKQRLLDKKAELEHILTNDSLDNAYGFDNSSESNKQAILVELNNIIKELKHAR